MDYPILRLLTGIGLIFSIGSSIGSAILLSKIHIQPLFRGMLLFFLCLSILPGFYVVYLLVRSMLPMDRLYLGLGGVVSGILIACLTLVFYRLKHYPSYMRVALIILSVTTGGVNLVLEYLLYRNLVPIPLF